MKTLHPDTQPSHDASLPEAATAADKATTIGSYCFAIGRALESSGVDSARIFKAAGITSELANNPMTRLPVTTVTRLYRACVEVTNNPYFGLTVARFIHLHHLHALGHALAASATLMDFCRRLARYFRLVSQVARVSLTETDGKVLLRFEYLVDSSAETEDAFLAFLVMTMRMLFKPGFNPLRAEFRRPMPRDGAEPYETLMRAPVSFSHAHSLLVFNKTDLMQALDGASPDLAQANDNIAISYLARLDKDDVITHVIQKIIEQLPDGECSREKVASTLCMSPSTLQLKLSRRGTNFQQLLDDTRKELACGYVRQPARSVTEITFVLGFTNTSNFTRAFKRWTGMSPTDFRQKP